MSSALNEESVEKKLKTVNNTQDSIQSLSLWFIHHKMHHAKIVEFWMKVMKKTVHPSHRLTLFYLCNDVVQTCKKKKAQVYYSAFKEHLNEAAALVRDISVKNKVERIFKIWEERGVFDAAFIKTLLVTLNGKAASLKSREDKKKHKKHNKQAPKAPLVDQNSGDPSAKSQKNGDETSKNGPISPPSTPQVDFTLEKPSVDIQENEERDAEESARILAEFKPHEMIDQITAFHRHKAEIQLKVNQLSHLKLDASSLEAIKHLKDRAHGNDFSSHFEDSCTKLEELVKHQTQQKDNQLTLLDTLKTSETFYEEQYREAKIVANAYKNYGARINNMKKRLDESKKSMLAPDSPFPSPDENAPSPGNTPPHVTPSGYNYTASQSDMGYQKQSWMYDGTDNDVAGSAGNEDIFDESPPLEAPSPDGTPPNFNFDGSETTSASFESRLASFFDRGQSSEQSTPAVYTPRLPTSNSKSYKPAEDDGSTTPLDDETPTTPVQDEYSASPPKRNTPPKKENPIDFLSRLISQSHKPTVPKSGTASFLDTLSLLSNVTKPQPSVTEPIKDPNPQQSWSAWKSKSNGESSPSSQPASPLAYSGGSQPASPTQYTPSRPPPSMVPPPPIPMPVPPPPMALSMGLNMLPPPPPPFTITSSGPSLDFSNPPPGFQQTSPGQKENWPESSNSSPTSDLLSASRAGQHNSVLKELVPADSFDGIPADKLLSDHKPSSSLMDPDMEIVSDEDDDELCEGLGDAKSEFAQKLKQKTQVASSLKSHVFVPNPERPNLMTLTVPDDLDEDDMIDDNTLLEDIQHSSWQAKSHKSSKKSRSRSRSKDRERSHKHKKKKKHKRMHSDEDDMKPSDSGDDGKGSLGNVIKRLGSHSGSRGDRYEDRYDDRKYDLYEDRDYRDKQRSHRSSKDSRDPVEAYTQAYRDAMFQQLNQGRLGSFSGGGSLPLDPRRYGKY